MKKVRFDTSEPQSVKFMAREIMILQKLDHPNIIKLEGLATSRMQYSIYLVFDYMQSDLASIISRPGGRLNESQVLRNTHKSFRTKILGFSIANSEFLIMASLRSSATCSSFYLACSIAMKGAFCTET